ncbi:MAG TPA: hypothetical protein VF297_17335 [Pyrinomonadaceae bacterium]
MPLEINEIAIQMQVADDMDDDDDDDVRRRGKKKKEKAKQKTKERGACCDFDREELVEDCARRVLQTLNRLRER